MIEAIQAADAAILLFLQDNVRCGALNFIMVLFTKLGDAGAIWLLTGMLFFVSRKYRKAGFDIIVAVGVCWCVNQLLKEVVMRPRPFAEIEQLTILVAAPDSWSFPSGHACSSFAAAYAYTRGFKKYGAWTYVGAVLIAVSRAYVGVHYPSDIIVGAIVGTVFAVIVYELSKKYIKIPEYVKPDGSESAAGGDESSYEEDDSGESGDGKHE